MHNTATEAAQYVYDTYLKHPYTAKSRYNRMSWGTHISSPLGTIYRPNHGLPHTLRTMAYIPVLRDFYEANGITDSTGRHVLPFEEIDDADILRCQLAMAFYVSGRESEDCFKNNRKLYNTYRADSARYFEKYISEKGLVGEGQPFASAEQLEQYREMVQLGFEGILQYRGNGARVHEYATKGHVLNLFMANAHSLDIARCRTTGEFRASTMEWYSKEYTRAVHSRDLDALILFAQECLVKTGDKVRAKFDAASLEVPGEDGPVKSKRPLYGRLRSSGRKIRLSNLWSIIYQVPYSTRRFYKCSNSIQTSLNAIESVEIPKFLSNVFANHQPTANEALEAINSGNGVLCQVEGGLNDKGIRTTLENLAENNMLDVSQWKKLSSEGEAKLNRGSFFRLSGERYKLGFLAGGTSDNGVQALKAIFVTDGSARAILQGHNAQNRIKADYGLSLPLMIINGKGTIQEVPQDDISRSLSKWERRFKHPFTIVRLFWKLFYSGVKFTVQRIRTAQEHERHLKTLPAQVAHTRHTQAVSNALSTHTDGSEIALDALLVNHEDSPNRRAHSTPDEHEAQRHSLVDATTGRRPSLP